MVNGFLKANFISILNQLSLMKKKGWMAKQYVAVRMLLLTFVRDSILKLMGKGVY